jgi:hypothetical protein
MGPCSKSVSQTAAKQEQSQKPEAITGARSEIRSKRGSKTGESGANREQSQTREQTESNGSKLQNREQDLEQALRGTRPCDTRPARRYETIRVRRCKTMRRRINELILDQTIGKIRSDTKQYETILQYETIRDKYKAIESDTTHTRRYNTSYTFRRTLFLARAGTFYAHLT